MSIVASASHGTCLSLAGLFYANRVKAGQVKQRADLHTIRQFITALAVLNPEVRFSLRQPSGEHSSAGQAPIIRLIQTSGSNNLRTVCGELLLSGAAAAAETIDVMKIIPFCGVSGVQIGGVVSVRPFPSPNVQLVCVNRRYVVDPQLAWEINVS